MDIIKGLPSTHGDDYQLNTTTLIRHAARTYPEQQIVYRTSDEDTWLILERLGAGVRAHFSTIGVAVVIDDTEGYAVNWNSMSALLADIPDLPGARCAGLADLFEATVDEHGKADTRTERERARIAALRLCNACPALAPCRAWLDGLRPTWRPRGVVAGQVIAANGQPSSNRTTGP